MKRTTFWLAYPSTPKGGIARILDELEALDIGACLSVRIGQAGNIENGVDEAMVQRVIDRIGLDRTEIWWGSHPTTWESELRLAARFHRMGVRRFVINAETAWKREGANAVAEKCSKESRKILPDSEIWHAPFAMMQSHGVGGLYKDKYYHAFPYLGFASLDGMFLQHYPNEFGGKRAEWDARYEREVKGFLKANPSVAKQKIVCMGDLYGSDFGRSWGLTPAAVKWDDSHLDSHLALSERMSDPEIAFYSIDAALSESERPVKGQPQSNPWGAVQRWAARLRAERAPDVAPVTQPAVDVSQYYDEEALMCLDPSAMQSCFDKAHHAVKGHPE